MNFAKPMIAPVCIFWTELAADRWSAPDFLNDVEAWNGPLEINADGLLASLS